MLSALCAPVVVRGEVFPWGSWQCLEMYLVVITGEELLLASSGRGQGCFQTFCNAWNYPLKKKSDSVPMQQCRGWEALWPHFIWSSKQCHKVDSTITMSSLKTKNRGLRGSTSQGTTSTSGCAGPEWLLSWVLKCHGASFLGYWKSGWSKWWVCGPGRDKGVGCKSRWKLKQE